MLAHCGGEGYNQSIFNKLKPSNLGKLLFLATFNISEVSFLGRFSYTWLLCFLFGFNLSYTLINFSYKQFLYIILHKLYILAPCCSYVAFSNGKYKFLTKNCDLCSLTYLAALVIMKIFYSIRCFGSLV